MKAEAVVIHPIVIYDDVVDLTGDDQRNTDEYLGISFDSSATVKLNNDLSATDSMQVDSVDNVSNVVAAETDVLHRCKSILGRFVEVIRGVIISLNNGRAVQNRVQQIHGSLMAATVDEQLRCFRYLDALLITSDFEVKTVAYDRRINEASLRTLIKRAYR